MNHLSLFSGIGGLDLAAEWAGFRTVAFVERDAYCQRVLARHWPGVPIFGDVRDVVAHDPIDGRGEGRARGSDPGRARQLQSALPLTVVSGGFPCQPHSVAGKRGASGDERDLWPEFARVIGEIKPRWVVAENVPGLVSSERGAFFGRILADLAGMGYVAGWGRWRASDVGALHRRERIFIVAHAARNESGREIERSERERIGLGGESCALADSAGLGIGAGLRQAGSQRDGHQPTDGGSDVAYAGSGGRSGPGQPVEPSDPAPAAAWEATKPVDGRESDLWRVESRLGGGLDGISGWLDGTFERGIPRVAKGVKDRVARLRALGNAVVPQQAYPLFKAIAEAEGMKVHAKSSNTPNPERN